MNVLRVFTVVAVLIGVAGMASAATNYWAVSASGDWEVAANWTFGTPPVPTDDVNFSTGNPGAAYTVSLNANQTCAYIVVGANTSPAGNGDNMTLDMGGFDLTGTRLLVGAGCLDCNATVNGGGGTIFVTGSNGFKMGPSDATTTSTLTLDNVTVDVASAGQFCLGRGSETDNLIIQNGAFVDADSSCSPAFGYSTSTVDVTITGANSKMKVTYSKGMCLGADVGSAISFALEDGGEFEVLYDLSIGWKSTGTAASVTVGRTGSATLTIGSDLDVGGDQLGTYSWAGSATGKGMLALGIGGTVTTDRLTTGANGELELDFDAVGGGQITATGNVDLTGAEFDFTNIGGLNSSGDTIDFIVTDTTITTDVTLDHDLDSIFASPSDYTFGVVTVGSQEALRLTYVPEPATLGLLCMGGVLVLVRRRRK